MAINAEGSFADGDSINTRVHSKRPINLAVHAPKSNLHIVETHDLDPTSEVDRL